MDHPTKSTLPFIFIIDYRDLQFEMTFLRSFSMRKYKNESKRFFLKHVETIRSIFSKFCEKKKYIPCHVY